LDAHDLADIARGIRHRYRGARPGPREAFENGTYGIYSRQLDHPSLDSVLIESISKEQLPDLWREAQTRFGSKSVRVYVDDWRLDAELEPHLGTEGCNRSCEMIYLAHIGEPPCVEQVENLTVERASADTVREYEVVRAKSFADSEVEPDPEEVTANAGGIAADLGETHLLLGRVEGEAAAIAGWYEGTDRLVFHLATRMPFRNRGIARHLLSHVIQETYTSDHRSVTIFKDPEETPVSFYRRMGFTEEVYWQARYLYRPR